METPIWKPTEKKIADSNITAFYKWLEDNHNLSFDSYDKLYNWSVEETELFWSLIWDYFQIISSEKGQKTVSDFESMPGAKWFPEAKLNFAENLLKYRDDRIAISFHGESNDKLKLTYKELYQHTASLSDYLKSIGIEAGDRIAAFMPNRPETIAGMLAATSIGAIWSSCSPDFGIQGVCDRFEQISPKVLFAVDGYFYNGKKVICNEKIEEIIARIPSIEKVILVSYANCEAPNLEDKFVFYNELIQDNPPEINFAQLPFSHPAYILYSSGTTGAPKCIVHSAGGTLIEHLKELALHTNLNREKTIFYFTTCGWMMWNWLVSSLALGAKIVLYDGSPFFPTAKRLFRLIEEEQINIFGVSAKYISAVEKVKVIPKEVADLSSLEAICSTGSPLSENNFEFVYGKIKEDVCLSSISGGTDIVGCFALGNPTLPVFRGELQVRSLGLDVAIFDDEGKEITEEAGELVCRKPFPSMPVYFWNDEDGQRYQSSYFSVYPNIWRHGDWAKVTSRGGLVIYGRSDATLNPGGVRIGTGEIYRAVEQLDEILESIVVGQRWESDERVILFIKLRDELELTNELKNKIKKSIRTLCSPRHVPARIVQVDGIPRTISGKISEMAVKNIIHGRSIKNKEALANPETLQFFENVKELQA